MKAAAVGTGQVPIGLALGAASEPLKNTPPFTNGMVAPRISRKAGV
jgi:hypothetical protein